MYNIYCRYNHSKFQVCTKSELEAQAEKNGVPANKFFPATPEMELPGGLQSLFFDPFCRGIRIG